VIVYLSDSVEWRTGGGAWFCPFAHRLRGLLDSAVWTRRLFDFTTGWPRKV